MSDPDPKPDHEWRRVLDALPALVWSSTSTGAADFVNARFSDYTGKNFQALGAGGLVDVVHPEDRDRVLAVRDASPVRFRLRRHDGRYRWHEARTEAVRDDSGTVVRWLTTATDVDEPDEPAKVVVLTERLVDSIEQAVIATDVEGRITHWNRFAEELYGWSRQEVLGKSILDVTPSDDMAEKAGEIFEKLSAGESWSGRFRLKRRDGSSFWAQVTDSPIRDANGELAGIVGVSTDVTDRVSAQDALERRVDERTEELAALTERLRRLAAELTDAEQRERRRVAKLLHDHVQQLLVAAQMRLGELKGMKGSSEFELTVDQTEGLLEKALESARSLTAELRPPALDEGGFGPALRWLVKWVEATHGLRVHVEAEPSSERALDEIRVLVFESVRELLLNVVKYAGVEEVFVSVGPAADRRVCVTVRDRGRGFDPDNLNRHDLSGGFGLFSIRERFQVLGGRVDVETSPGKGTTVRLVTSASVLRPLDAHAVHAGGDGRPLVRPVAAERAIRVLLADDHQIVRQGIASFLKSAGDVEVVAEVNDGWEAVHAVETLHPDVVVLDVRMPRMTGIEAARLIRRTKPDVRIIGLSVYGDEWFRDAMMRLGAGAYLIKDASAEDLLDRIREICGRNGSWTNALDA